MALAARSNTKKRDIPSVGTKMARLVNLIDLGHQPGFEWQGEQIKSQYKIAFTYELTGSMTQEGMPHHVTEDVNVSDYVGDGIISKMMKRVFALDPTGVISDNGKNLPALIGLPCMVTIQHNKNGYEKISEVSGAPEGIPVPELKNDPKIFNMDEPDMNLYHKLPDYVKDKMQKALDFNETALSKELLKSDVTGETDNENF